jgi:hypothetical protein
MSVGEGLGLLCINEEEPAIPRRLLFEIFFVPSCLRGK